ncbi:toll/interleukin-1 receptor domain-containing protein [Mycolicibacterium sp.]|uniref:toll/interleukin-1 receptor domain-containing protein n=1 Tax=Mycolicibacterium sp. TaxID=2320850 RepID=UPI0028ABB852|nr:toll/interleukin-1 receptor domain-containing protein [Mycolicibacterium sp.]
MRRLFISYARENKPDIESLVRDLESLGYETWLDSSLRGGQKWWDEILQRIADSDVFVTAVSVQSLNSVACRRELEWASALNKPVLPLALGPLPDALPRALSTRQITPYSTSAREAAFALAGALGNLPPAEPVPNPLPQAPSAPLSYLTDLIDHVNQSEPLTHDQQREILVRLEPALDSADPEEARGARYVLETFSKRDDLYADIAQSLEKLGIAALPSAGGGSPAPKPVAAAAHSAGISKGVLGIGAVGLLAAAGVVGFLLTRGGGDSTPPATSGSPAVSTPAAPATDKPASLTGRWSGRVFGDQTLELVADINDGPPLSATVSYPEIPCQCTWTQSGSARGGVRYVTETVDSGPCSRSQITLIPQEDGTISFSSTYYSAEKQRNMTIQGTLSRDGAP